MDYPKYPDKKEVDIGLVDKIPAHWDVKRLKFMCSIENGRDYKGIEAQNYEDSYPVYGSGGAFGKASDYLFDGESVLFGRKGTIDKPLYVKGKFWTVDTMFYSRIYPDVSAKYLYYASQTISFDLIATQTALPSITQSDLSNYFVCCPPKEEQVQIYQYLDYKVSQIDDLINTKADVIEKLGEQRITLITQAVTKGINPEAPTKDSEIEWLGDIPEHWDVKRLKFMSSIQNGCDYKSIEVQEYEDGYPVYGSGGAFRKASQYLYDGPSVLFGRKGTIDKPLFVNGKFWTVDTMFYSIIENDVLPEFMYYSALTVEYKYLATQTALPSITQSDLSNYFTCCPPYDEQVEIKEYLDTVTSRIDKMICVNKEAIDKLQEYRSALITAAVTGLIDVRNIEIPEEY